MKERGKAVETYSGGGGERDVFFDFNYSAPDNPCEKHPSAYPIGVCPHCLKERLIKLVCSDCGEQRLSSCSCSEVSSSSNRNSSATEAASVGRISFLIENERAESKIKATKKNGVETEEFVILKRSNSSCVVGAKRRSSGFWRVVRLFKKKREKANEKIDGGDGGGGDDQKSDLWVFDYMGVSRSRSLCSFRGGAGGGVCSSYDPDEGSSDFAFSSAKISDFNGRSSMESSRMSGFSEAEPRKSGIRVLSDSETSAGGVIKRVGGLKESDFTKHMDESSFIDLKLDSLSESKPEFSVPELMRLRNGDNFLGSHESLRRGGSCRIPKMDETKRIGKDKRGGHKVWRWITRHHPNWGTASRKNDQ